MNLPDETRSLQSNSVSAVKLRVEKGEARNHPTRFTNNFVIGRSAACEVQLAGLEVSSRHVEIVWENGQWWAVDLNSTNGTFLNGRRIKRELLASHNSLQLASNGPVILLEVEMLETPTMVVPAEPKTSATQIVQRLIGTVAPSRLGTNTMFLREAFQRLRRRQAKRYWAIIGVVAAFLLVAVGGWLYQSWRVKKLERVHLLAEEIFYTMKTLELQLAELQTAVAAQPDSPLRQQIMEKLKQQAAQRDDYDKFAMELGISREKLSEEDWLIYRITRLFGECDASMPPEFVKTVKKYIRMWKSTPRLREALQRAAENGYTPAIVQTLLANNMPPQFFYLGLKESYFDVKACGPSTRYGIAKGLWQFIPMTATQYGLRTGPLLEVRRYDPRDERHDFVKSTAAAAKYLRDLYQTEAQASGLLVMAAYNWGQGNVRSVITRLPKNPAERNFWKLLTREKIPQETYDYVFYIVAAAVIGENPNLFGFDFDNPLPAE
jgi:pSer/pThr/pTyr-binding forkhead associated (FHA) protein